MCPIGSPFQTWRVTAACAIRKGIVERRTRRCLQRAKVHREFDLSLQLPRAERTQVLRNCCFRSMHYYRTFCRPCTLQCTSLLHLHLRTAVQQLKIRLMGFDYDHVVDLLSLRTMAQCKAHLLRWQAATALHPGQRRHMRATATRMRVETRPPWDIRNAGGAGIPLILSVLAIPDPFQAMPVAQTR